ncbi:SPX domain-domain-containing protein [Leucosporidium creatinivorum]|uniref:SPX domain-domain-containing protein n=1 Tax=Leucosporidium creatinivorum TaxID=106004 RepID=A0A1Y2ECV0_9BASI|nr:SPX domain-domain-containing protein [Leucosporidium creatinivorum]
MLNQLSALFSSARNYYYTTPRYQLDQPTDPDVELLPVHRRPLSPPAFESSPSSSEQLQPHLKSLLKRAEQGLAMKFETSLLFNAVPEWTSYYINYGQLKTAIYRFEKQALAPPPTSYTDEEPTPSNLESAQLLASSSTVTTPSTNEKVFTRLLDQELHKITEFYVDKERELLGDLAMLQADVERIEDEASGLSGQGVTSGGSDTEDEEGGGESDEDEQGVAARTGRLFKGAIETVFSNPSNYDAAKRAGRKARMRRHPSSSRSVDGKGKRPRAWSNASGTSDLLDLEEEPAEVNGEAIPDGVEMPTTPALKRSRSNHLPVSPGPRKRELSKMGQSVASFGDEDDGLAEGFWAGKSDWAIDNRIMYKRRIAALYTSLSELKQYVDLNYTGLSKVLKKYDKITNSTLRAQYMKNVVDTTFPFEPVTQERLGNAIQSLVPLYADIATGGNEEGALKQLNAHLREHVVWERNTVWREMIGLERRGWGGAAGSGSGKRGTDVPIVQGVTVETKTELNTPVGRFYLPSWLTSQVVAGVLALLLFGGLLNAQWFDRVEEQNCLALLAFVTIFWALEIVPLFVTALMVPFLVVVLRVLRSSDGEDRRLSASESTKYIFGQMFSPTIMLLLGGFTLAAALSKQNIDKVLATKVLSLAGTKPKSVLLAYMCVACFASMWISNVAAPVLCYSLIQPILRTLPPQAPFSKSLILGIALASNIGGMASPISSPQNLIALEYMTPAISWLGWFAVSIPVASTSIFIIWLILLWSYRSGKGIVINPVRVNREPWTKTQWFVSVVTLATIVLWCVESRLAWLLGDMGIIAIIPIVLFYGTGILRKADFDHSPWSIVFLAMGGIALGKAVLSSGLLDDMDSVIQDLVLGLDIWPILAIFSVVVLVIATLISHTIASVLVVPIAAQIGAAMEVPHPRLLIFATALICSAGMGLPISGFPNLQAINVEDDMGQRYLEPSDFFKNGIPASVIAVIVVITVGYGIMRALGL